MRKRGWPPPLRIKIASLLVTVYFDGPHFGTCSKCGKPAHCGLYYTDAGEPVPPDAVYVEGGESPWMFHLNCDTADGKGDQV